MNQSERRIKYIIEINEQGQGLCIMASEMISFFADAALDLRKDVS